MPAWTYTPSLAATAYRANRKARFIETRTAFFARYYHTAEDGTRKQKAVKLCEKSDLYRSKADVQPLMDRLMESVNAGQGSELITGEQSLSDFIEKHYFPWCEVNKSAPTVNGYKQIWNCYLKPHIGNVALVNLTTAQVTGVLTHLAEKGGRKKTGLGRYALSHVKFVLSGVYEYAIATGVIGVEGPDQSNHRERTSRRVRLSAINSTS